MDDQTARGAAYLQEWHDRHPGATSELLGSMTDDVGRNSYEVLAEAIRQGSEPVLDLACGDGYLLELLRVNQACLGTDWNVAELNASCRRLGYGTPLVQADAASLPIATAALGTVGCHFALMLLQPLEQVLAELARVLRHDGLLASVLPATTPPDHGANPISVFRAAWQEVTSTFKVDIPPIQDDRAVDSESLAALLADAGFTSVSVQPFSVTKQVTIEETIQSLFLTYLPDLLPPAGVAQLNRTLEIELAGLAADTGTITFVEPSNLVCARRR